MGSELFLRTSKLSPRANKIISAYDFNPDTRNDELNHDIYWRLLENYNQFNSGVESVAITNDSIHFV